MSHQIKKQNIYEQVIEHLQQYMLDNSLRPGDRLPTEAEMAEQFGVGRQSIREAMKVLESVGVIETRPRDGSRLKALNVRHLGDHLRFMFKMDGVTFKEMAASRLIIECAVLPVAAENADEADFRHMAGAIERMHRCINDEAEYVLADMEFHKALLAATKNRVLQGFGNILHAFFLQLQNQMISDKQAKIKSIDDHRRIQEALRARDVVTARTIMQEHLSVYSSPVVPVVLKTAVTTVVRGDSSQSPTRPD